MTRYSKTVTPSGDDEWVSDPDGTHEGHDRGSYIEMIPIGFRPITKPLPKENDQ